MLGLYDGFSVFHCQIMGIEIVTGINGTERNIDNGVCRACSRDAVQAKVSWQTLYDKVNNIEIGKKYFFGYIMAQ